MIEERCLQKLKINYCPKNIFAPVLLDSKKKLQCLKSRFQSLVKNGYLCKVTKDKKNIVRRIKF